MNKHIDKQTSANGVARTALYAAVALALAGAGPLAHASSVASYTSPVRVINTLDVIGDFDGQTVTDDPNIINCTSTDPAVTYVDRVTGALMCGVDSSFGFIVFDFIGALQKTPDGAYEEGWVGDILEDTDGDGIGDTVVGLAARDARTASFKAPQRYGTWCQGLGSEDAKCETEHYSVMENVRTCYETIPYFDADPVTGLQRDLFDPETGELIDTCENWGLDNELFVLECVVRDPVTDLCLEGEVSETLWDGTLEPNEATVTDQLAVGSDYTISLKDDGKALYRWGNKVKRPTDLRMYVDVELPAEWTQDNDGDGAIDDYEITRAWLTTVHKVSNNPNDQIRPEDYENEQARGLKPEFTVVPTAIGENWLSAKDCYEGDGTFIPAGTYLRNNNPDAYDPAVDMPFLPLGILEGPSEDLREGWTNAWYTTIDRDPFEWAYDCDGDGINDTGSKLPLADTACTLISGPRFRLTSIKYGQDLPGLDIEAENCSPPPVTQDEIKYPVLADAVTVINVLDGAGTVSEIDADADGIITEEELEASGYAMPLGSSLGWVDNQTNPNLSTEYPAVSVNGLKLTPAFDIAFYFKGEAGNRTAQLFTTQLEVDYRIPNPVDWGDAPEGTYEIDVDGDGVLDLVTFNYPVTGDAGASHLIVNDDTDVAALALGADADPEWDGQPSLDALLDDTTGAFDDEDGIEFESAFLPSGVTCIEDVCTPDPETTAKIAVTFRNEFTTEICDDANGDGVITPDECFLQTTAPYVGTAYLNGWIDWNRDGDWDDARENVIVNCDLMAPEACPTFVGIDASGRTRFEVPVPYDASIGTSYARFRLSSTGDLVGGANPVDGEVEDYLIDIGGQADDVVGRNRLGDVWVGLSNATRFDFAAWAPRGFPARYRPLVVGDYNGDGKDDVAAPRIDTGDLRVGVSGVSPTNPTVQTFVVSSWGNRGGIDYQGFVPGDYNGDGWDDVAQRAVENGNLWVSEADKADADGDGIQEEFLTSNWGGPFIIDPETGVDPWRFFSYGDFNGDGRRDVVALETVETQWWIAVSSTRVNQAGEVVGTFDGDNAGTQPEGFDIALVRVGDFDGDGLDDIGFASRTTGNYQVRLARVSPEGDIRFEAQDTWLTGNVDLRGDVVVSDLNQDGLDDLLIRESGGTLVAAISSGNPQDGFLTSLWGRLDGSELQVADFTGDGFPDAAAVSNSGEWSVAGSVDGTDFDNPVSFGAWDSGIIYDIGNGDFDGPITPAE